MEVEDRGHEWHKCWCSRATTCRNDSADTKQQIGKTRAKEGMVMDLVGLQEGSCWRCGSLASQKGQRNKTSKA